MNDTPYYVTTAEGRMCYPSKRFYRNLCARNRMARMREKRGAAVGTSISLPPEVHEAASRLLAISRRGRDADSQRRAYLTGCMMVACAGQQTVAHEMSEEFSTIKSYLASLDASTR